MYLHSFNILVSRSTQLVDPAEKDGGHRGGRPSGRSMERKCSWLRAFQVLWLTHIRAWISFLPRGLAQGLP